MPDTTSTDQTLRTEALNQTQRLFKNQHTKANVDCLIRASQKVYEFIRDNAVPLDLTNVESNTYTVTTTTGTNDVLNIPEDCP